MAWNEPRLSDPLHLREARLSLHHGALVLGSVAHSVLEHADDDGHSNLGFEGGALVTRPLSEQRAITLQLEVAGFALRLVEGSASSARELQRTALAGLTVEEALAWVGSSLGAALGTEVEIRLREYPDFPDSPLADGAAFEKPPAAHLAELGRWFANGVALLEVLRGRFERMTERRVWPHHFDLGALVPLDAESPAGDGGERMLGVGLSPGDQHYDQPYFYCAPYPNPAVDTEAPDLAVGHWHRSGFLSAIVTAEELQAQPDEAAAARAYLDSAVAGGLTLLG